MSKTASEYLVEALEKTGVKRVYGVVGDSLNGFTDALRRRKSIDWIHMRHEEAAAFAAAPIFTVIERVVLGLMTWIRMAWPPGCRPQDRGARCARELACERGRGLRLARDTGVS